MLCSPKPNLVATECSILLCKLQRDFIHFYLSGVWLHDKHFLSKPSISQWIMCSNTWKTHLIPQTAVHRYLISNVAQGDHFRRASWQHVTRRPVTSHPVPLTRTRDHTQQRHWKVASTEHVVYQPNRAEITSALSARPVDWLAHWDSRQRKRNRIWAAGCLLLSPPTLWSTFLLL